MRLVSARLYSGSIEQGIVTDTCSNCLPCMPHLSYGTQSSGGRQLPRDNSLCVASLSRMQHASGRQLCCGTATAGLQGRRSLRAGCTLRRQLQQHCPLLDLRQGHRGTRGCLLNSWHVCSRAQLPLLRERWRTILAGAVFQYVHAMATQLAHRMHQPLAQPLHDLGFDLLPVRCSPDHDTQTR